MYNFNHLINLSPVFPWWSSPICRTPWWVKQADPRPIVLLSWRQNEKDEEYDRKCEWKVRKHGLANLAAICRASSELLLFTNSNLPHSFSLLFEYSNIFYLFICKHWSKPLQPERMIRLRYSNIECILLWQKYSNVRIIPWKL